MSQNHFKKFAKFQNTKFLPNGNYTPKKRYAAMEIFKQYCSDFAKKKNKILHINSIKILYLDYNTTTFTISDIIHQIIII